MAIRKDREKFAVMGIAVALLLREEEQKTLENAKQYGQSHGCLKRLFLGLHTTLMEELQILTLSHIKIVSGCQKFFLNNNKCFSQFFFFFYLYF